MAVNSYEEDFVDTGGLIDTYPTRNICFPCWFTNAVIAYGDRTLTETPYLWSYRLLSSRAAGPDEVSM